uniref:Uncharacterized protein n=1 Tax=Brassica oleracea TaxID=3712 RepID=A0A3P6ARM7_BRAOL|nr:unnamed protein product [Brassica oleracea]
MQHFQELVADCNLLDLPYVGSVFTWWNKRGLDLIGFFPNSYAEFDVGGVSDNARCLVTLTVRQASVRKPFKLFNFLIENVEFAPTNFAASVPPEAKGAEAVYTRLNRTHYGDLSSRTKVSFDDLCPCQTQVLINPCTATFQVEYEAATRWYHLSRIEEQLFQQKSRI